MRDRYGSVAARLPLRIDLLGVYHDFEAAAGDFRYGSEIDFRLTRKLGRATLQLKHASYFGGGDPAAGDLAFDRTITWFSTRFNL